MTTDIDTDTQPTEDIAAYVMALHTGLIRGDLAPDTTLEDLEVDPLDRSELALFIEDKTGGTVSDDEIDGWQTLGDVVSTYTAQMK